MPDTFTAALIGAGGAVLGSAISVLPTFWAEAVRARRERDAESLRSACKLREAGRLIAEELREVQRHLESAAGRAPCSADLVRLPLSAWETYRAVLARQLGPADWNSLADAYDRVMRLNRAVIEHNTVAMESIAEREVLADSGDLRSVWGVVVDAIWLLDDEVGIPTKPDSHLAWKNRRRSELWPEGAQATA